MHFVEAQLVTNGDMSTTAINSNGIDMNQLMLASVQAVFTGSPNGTFKLQLSNDIVAIDTTQSGNRASNVVNWTDYTGSSEAIVAAGNFEWNLVFAGYRWLRLVYTKSSGSGTLNVTFSGKG